jgi:hypothetical protein
MRKIKHICFFKTLRNKDKEDKKIKISKISKIRR